MATLCNHLLSNYEKYETTKKLLPPNCVHFVTHKHTNNTFYTLQNYSKYNTKPNRKREYRQSATSLFHCLVVFDGKICNKCPKKKFGSNKQVFGSNTKHIYRKPRAFVAIRFEWENYNTNTRISHFVVMTW